MAHNSYVALSKEKQPWNLSATFSSSVAIISVALLSGLAMFSDYSVEKATDRHVDQYYMFYIHVAIMIFVGFGFLMTFLKRYSYSAVGLNFFASCVVIIEFLLIGGAVQQMVYGPQRSYVLVDLPLLIDAAFAAGAAMISFGAVLGKTSPTQLLWLLVLQVPVYAFNAHAVTDYFKALDIGGSVSIHAFGAYYGLAASLALAKGGAFSHPKNGASYVSDVTAMAGTIFLWIFWPSFNGALASAEGGTASAAQFHCIINTVLSLLGACVATFGVSAALEGKFNMVHIQNATLAGGVAIGSAANLKLVPAFAVGTGMAAGLVSTLGYHYLSPLLESSIRLHDTCGVHNLHGMPGILGGLVAALASVVMGPANASLLAEGQAGKELAALGCTLAVALVSGYAAGLLVAMANPFKQSLEGAQLFEDAVFWAEVEEEEEEGEQEGAHA